MHKYLYNLQNACLESPMDRGVWWATVHGGQKDLERNEGLSSRRITDLNSLPYVYTHSLLHTDVYFPSLDFVFHGVIFSG